MARPLICPTCHEPLLLVGAAYDCRRCPASYAVRDGIPILLPAQPGTLTRQESDYWNQRFDLEANGPHLQEMYGNAEFIEDGWRLLGYLHRVLRSVAAGSTILEVGTGIGSQAIPLALHHGYAVVVTDVADRGLVINRSAACAVRDTAAIEYYAAEAEHLPFADDSFDVVLLHAALHHLPEPERAIVEMTRCLRRGGLLVLGYEPNRFVFAPMRKLADRLRITEKYSRRFVADRYSIADDETPGFYATELRRWVSRNELEIVWFEPVWLVAALLYHIPPLTHVLLGRDVNVPASLRRFAQRFDSVLFRVLPPLRWLNLAWSLGARKH